jgi:hypothetical protein
MNALISLVYSVIAGFPAGSVVDHILVTVTGATAGATPLSQKLAPDASSVTFANLPADTYTVTAQGFPAIGAGFGTPAGTTFTITAPATVSLSLPATVTAAQS